MRPTEDMVIRGGLRPRFATLLWAGALCLLASACSETSETPPAVTVDAGLAVDTALPQCAPQTRRLDGACCDEGAYYDYATGSCLAVGPPECATNVLAAPQECVPRWCAAWRMADGSQCDPAAAGCVAAGQPCATETSAASAGCPAGTWPWEGACVQAGPASAPPNDDPTALRIPAGAPALQPLPDLAHTRFCRGDDGWARLCTPDEGGCPPGFMPPPTAGPGAADAAAGTPSQAPAACIPVGAPWTCPPGFVVDPDPATPTGIPACVADPGDCTGGPWGELPDGLVVRYVAADAAVGGDGSKDKPWSDLAVALAEAPTGATVALAAGTYDGMFLINRELSLRGRCAAEVRLRGPSGAASTLLIYQLATQTHVSRITLTGETMGYALASGTGHRLERVWLRDLRGSALFATGGVGTLDMVDCLVANTRLWDNGSGDGTVMSGAAQLNLERVRISRGNLVGLLVSGSNGRTTARELIVDETQPIAHAEGGGYGAAVFQGARLHLISSRVTASNATGAFAFDFNSRLLLTASAVDNTRPDTKSGTGGTGVVIGNAARGDLQGVRLWRNSAMGLGVEGPACSAQGNGLLIDDTLPQVADGTGGWGVGTISAGKAVLSDVRISAARATGISIAQPGSALIGRRLLVDGTLPQASTSDNGVGLQVLLGATAAVQDSRFTGNLQAGASAYHAGTHLSMREVLVDATAAGIGGDFGSGLEIGLGATADLLGVLLHGNRSAGLTIAAGSSVRAAGLEVVGTLPRQSDEVGGMGVQVGGGARLELSGSALRHNHLAGLLSYGDGPTMVRATGVLIADTQLEVDSQAFGTGAYALPGVKNFELLHCLLSRNRSAGVAFYEASGLVQGCAIIATAGANYRFRGSAEADKVELSDGIVAHKGQNVRMEHNVVVDQLRAGLLLVENAAVTLVGNRSGGGLFGVATQDNGAVHASGNLLEGTGKNQAGDGGLHVPPAPVPL